jgi:hypothetical protein
MGDDKRQKAEGSGEKGAEQKRVIGLDYQLPFLFEYRSAAWRKSLQKDRPSSSALSAPSCVEKSRGLLPVGPFRGRARTSFAAVPYH